MLSTEPLSTTALARAGIASGPVGSPMVMRGEDVYPAPLLINNFDPRPALVVLGI
jgi:hypothetical protein